MTDRTTAVRRALFAVAGSALALGSGAGAAVADDLDTDHLSVNQGAACAVRDLGETGEHVMSTGALPKVFNHVDASPGADGVKALCGAVDRTPSAAGGVSHEGQGLLGGLPLGG